MAPRLRRVGLVGTSLAMIGLGCFVYSFSSTRGAFVDSGKALTPPSDGSALPQMLPSPSRSEGDRVDLVGSTTNAATVPSTAADPHENRYANASEGLLMALEDSMAQVLDTQAILDAAKILVDANISSHALAEPGVDGGVRFPLEGMPENVNAALVLRAFSNEAFSDALTLELCFESPDDAYVVEGAARYDPRLDITAWIGKDGNLSNYSILTSLHVDYGASESCGMQARQGRYPVGLRYHVPAANPGNWNATLYELVDDELVKSSVTPSTTSVPKRQIEDAAIVAAGMLRWKKFVEGGPNADE